VDFRLLQCLAVGFAIWGCSEPPYSLRPTYSASRLIWDPAFVGYWGGSDGDSWAFSIERTGYYRYSLTMPADTGAVHYTAYLFRVGTATFIDLTPSVPEPSFLMVPVHMWARVHLRADTLWYGYLPESNWERIADQHAPLFVRTSEGPLPLVANMPPESLAVLIERELEDSTVDWDPHAFAHRPPLAAR
jgi:hypothetical protein